jgi:myosin-9
MNANALAIVFAPCILRTGEEEQAQDALKAVSRQTGCVQVIIEEQIKKVNSTMADISVLENARQSAFSSGQQSGAQQAMIPLLEAGKAQLTDNLPSLPVRKISRYLSSSPITNYISESSLNL